MARIAIAFLFALAWVCGLASGYALPGACSGICTNTHDPSIIVRDGVYHRFSTGGRVAVHTAPNITGPWTYKGPALPNGSIINMAGRQDLWAPDVSRVDDQYYLYYSVSTFGSQTSAIGLARSPDLSSWTDLDAIITSDRSKAYNAIDAHLLEANGSKLLTFGSFWNGLYQIQMQTPPTSIQPGAQPYRVSGNSADKAQEGATVFRNGEYYYLFYSKGTCCGYDARKLPAPGKEYKIMVCRSTLPTGGFVDRSGTACTSGGGSVVLESHDWVYGPGGQGVFEDAILGPVLYYHYVDTRVGYADGQKRFGWNKLDFSAGWPVA